MIGVFIARSGYAPYITKKKLSKTKKRIPHFKNNSETKIQVYTFYLNPNNVTNEVTVMHKCSFLPPTGTIEGVIFENIILISEVEFWFNLIACVTSYAIPLFGIIYWLVFINLKNSIIDK